MNCVTLNMALNYGNIPCVWKLRVLSSARNMWLLFTAQTQNLIMFTSPFMVGVPKKENKT